MMTSLAPIPCRALITLLTEHCPPEVMWRFPGPVSAVRMKSDVQQRSKIAFVELEMAVDAQRALRECSGSLLGALTATLSQLFAFVPVFLPA